MAQKSPAPMKPSSMIKSTVDAATPLQAAQQTAKRADHAAMGAPPMEFMQLFVVTPLLTQVRFGDWDGILAEQLDARHRPCNFVPHLKQAAACESRG